MELPPSPHDDALISPTRAQLFEELASLRRPATTQELAGRIGRHPNSVRKQLQHLGEAGLVECREVRQARGRPRHVWAIPAKALPGGQPPQAHGQLSRWLARAIGSGPALARVELEGRRIGHELAPQPLARALPMAMHDALAALGFSPATAGTQDGIIRHTLGNCPYRDAVRENQAAVCTLHRGITLGLIDRLQPGARLVGFVAKDPDKAGCLIDVAVADA